MTPLNLKLIWISIAFSQYILTQDPNPTLLCDMYELLFASNRTVILFWIPPSCTELWNKNRPLRRFCCSLFRRIQQILCLLFSMALIFAPWILFWLLGFKCFRKQFHEKLQDIELASVMLGVCDGECELLKVLDGSLIVEFCQKYNIPMDDGPTSVRKVFKNGIETTGMM